MGKELDNIDLSLSERKEITALLKRYLPDTEVWAYGSRVKFTAKPTSDLDLVAFTSKEQNAAVANLREAFEENSLPFRVDLFIWDRVPKQFHKNIEAERVVLQKKAEKKCLPEGWEEKTLKDIGKIITGKTPSTREKANFGGPTPFVTPRDFNGSRIIYKTERYLSEEGTKSVKKAIPINSIMVSCIGSDMGKTAITGKDCVTNQQINSIIVDDRFCYKYIYYDLSTRKDEIRGKAGGSAQPILNKTHFSQLKISLPPLPEQKAIAHILGSLDDKIELNQRMNETLEAMAQALFKSWFVDFDPVIDNALAAGNEIPEELKEKAEILKALGNTRKPLPEEIRTLFPSEFEYTEEMGWIPKGWRVCQIGELLELAYGKALSAKNRVTGFYPVYGSGGIVGYHNEPLVKGPGIIVGRKGTVGSVFWENGDFFPIDTVFFVKLLQEVPLYWIYQRLSLMNIASLGADSAVPGVNRNAVHAKTWIFPDANILKKYWALFKAKVEKFRELEQQSRILSNLRDTLLPKLLLGEIRIPEAEKLA